jgi:hypothetical protein
MAHYTLIARINAGHWKFPFANVQFSRNHLASSVSDPR